MGMKEMFELSALLKMQLPVLTSFAVFRWLIGLCCIALRSRFKRVELATQNGSLMACRRTLSVIGWSLLLLAFGHSMENTRFDNLPNLYNPYSVCEHYSNHKVQGYLCASALICLVTSNTSIDLGLSLATLKGVADTSLLTFFLAMMSWSRPYLKGSLFFTLVLGVSLLYSVGCYTDGSKGIGSAVLAASFSSLFLTAQAVSVCVVYSYKFTRRRTQALRKSALKLARLVRTDRERKVCKLD